MRRMGFRQLCGALSALFLMGDIAHAQTTETFEDLAKRLKPGDVVDVVEKGRLTRGQVVEIAPMVIVVRVAEELPGRGTVYRAGVTRTLAVNDVQRISRVDVSGRQERGAPIYQRVPTSFQDLQAVLAVGQQIAVRGAGSRMKGKVSRVDGSSLEVRVGSETRSFVEGSFTEIRTADGLGNGLGIGLGIGVGLGYLLAVPQADSGAQGHPWATLWGVAALGGVVGYAIDAATVGRVIYRSSGNARGVSIAPFLQDGRKGVLASWRF